MVICYSYLWAHEHSRGRDEGVKDRPCVIVLASENMAGDATIVTVAPVTHTQPQNLTAAIELPASIKSALKLDHARSWIILDQVNRFFWPGHDLRPVRSNKPGFVYGFIPPNLLVKVGSEIKRLVQLRKISVIPRS
jgi:mRNA-degrading endonuclease toxin of MazEF toxin-antitoxin module